MKVELLTASAQNWCLKIRLDTDLCQVLIDVKYTRDWQLGLKKNLQGSVVKPIIEVYNWSFPLEIYLLNVSISAVLCGYVHIY